jgi:hypothetical protein
MRVANQAMQREIKHIEQARHRTEDVLKQRQAALKAGYDADLADRDQLTRTWVKQATAGYVAAREALLRQAMQQKRRQTQRIDNLEAAGHAQRRAINLIEKQDQLVQRALGGDLWRWQNLLSEANASQ